LTYSIVARDPQTGDLGVGVQTHQPAVGAIVPWVRPGVGAVATQSFANVNFGPQGLALLESGLDAASTLAALLAPDPMPARRQVAVIGASGPPAVHTGDGCIPFAGHQAGEHYSVQANMMLRETVPAAMAAAFESEPGPLPARILAALDAAQGEGGDIRGMQSAAILVRPPGQGVGYRWDLRVDNDPQPLAKLRQLVNIRLAGDALGAEEQSRPEDPGEALAAAMAAFEEANRLAPHDEQTFWFAVRTLNDALGETERAAELLWPIFERAPHWLELLRRLPMLENRSLLDRFPR
jgi:uncharacterized Ntn-hydrolase superfamily protein